MGMAMRGGMDSAEPLDCRKRLVLPVMADFHHKREHENNGAGDDGERQRDVAIGDAHVGMHAAQGGRGDGTEDGQQKADREADKRAKEGDQADAHGDDVPAGRPGCRSWHTPHSTNSRLSVCAQAANITRYPWLPEA